MEFSPLVVFVLLSTTAKCVFVSAAGASTCDSCTCSKDKKEDECDRIRLVDPTRDGSAGKIEVCIGNYWKLFACRRIVSQIIRSLRKTLMSRASS